MMDDAVDDRLGHIVVKEELAPVCERLVGGQDDRPVFIQRVDELKRKRELNPIYFFRPALVNLYFVDLPGQ